MPSTQEREPRIKINKQQGNNQCFDEELGEAGHLRMMQIPRGQFMMGSPDDEPERERYEGPQHEVTIQPFFMGKYPVTQLQWWFVAGLEQVNRELNPEPSQFKEGSFGEASQNGNRPVEQVNWHEAVEFCDRLSCHTGREYRLPTEAEWEYACRAGTTTPFHFGETISTELANYDGANEEYGAYGRGERGDRQGKTTPVTHFDVANAWGLCDMHGNVFEWCQDHWHSNYEGAPTDGSARLTDNKEASRILRGGSWISLPRDCRSAYRLNIRPDDRFGNIGFRVVCSAPRTL